MFNFIIELLSKGFLFFALHIRNAGSFPPALSAEDEKECLELMRNGDLKAKNKLVEHNLRLVAHIIKKYYSNYSDQHDLISLGTIGLVKAVNSFDESKGIRFATYASKCIENEILMYFRGKKKNSNEISINEPIETDNEGNPLTLMDIINSEDNISENIDLKIKTELLYEYIENMRDLREKTIIVYRYGLFNTEPLTQKEVAKMLGISRSYVSRIEKKILKNMRNWFKEKRITE